ncbi:hypothetical protein PM082_024060 [Marasmius tenuissimus]|nr:hypothetical protein PM082_024060 [Marasmius tenuissimus]
MTTGTGLEGNIFPIPVLGFLLSDDFVAFRPQQTCRSYECGVIGSPQSITLRSHDAADYQEIPYHYGNRKGLRRNEVKFWVVIMSSTTCPFPSLRTVHLLKYLESMIGVTLPRPTLLN